MKYQKRSALALAACLAALPAFGDTTGQSSPPAGANILNPDTAPIIVIHIGRHRLIGIPTQTSTGTGVSVGANQIKNNPAAQDNLKGLIVSTVAGAASAPSGEFHVRGSHGQYTYYLDGAPLPQSVAGTFSDLINPKDIETLNVYTGGFPAKYGDDLAAIFDIIAKAGNTGNPSGFIQQYVEGYSTYESDGQVEGGDGRMSYFLSGIKHSSNRILDPQTPDPLHDAGMDDAAFGKFEYRLATGDRLILDTAHSDGAFQISNTPDREALGQNDVQKENGDIGNLILREDHGSRHLSAAFYSHNSELRYFPSLADLIQEPGNLQDLGSVDEDQWNTYWGLRTDYSFGAGKRHQIGTGFDVDTMVGHEYFNYTTSTPNASNTSYTTANYLEDQYISGGDRSVYLQDDWTPGRWLVDYGARYDNHKADTDTSQVSPRLNLYYSTSGRDKFHAFYDRLFQPAEIEDVRKLDPTTAPFKPERDNFYEAGWQHTNGGITTGATTYYKTEQDVVDENILPGTNVPEPFNVAKGYVRGLEFTIDGALSPTVSFYGNYARSWAKSAGQFTGGFNTPQNVVGYFYDDHDQTDTASFGTSYERKGKFADLEGEYGSGFPYGEVDNPPGSGNAVAVNYLFLEPHLIFNLETGQNIGHSQIAFTVDNILNHPYTIKLAGSFSGAQYGAARTLGVRYTLNF